MEFNPKGMATAIGSMPHDDPQTAVGILAKTLPQCPSWPQLPKISLNEQMEIQYSEGMPCRVIDTEKRRMFFQTDGDYSDAFAEFYEAYMVAMDPDEGNGDCASMAIGPDFSRGLYALEENLKVRDAKPAFAKVQTTGPCSFGLTIVDQDKRAIYYNEEFRDIIVKALAMKCRWQVQKFKPLCGQVICFVDEPILSGFGSSTYVSVQRNDVIENLSEMRDAIHADGGLAGIHCCGNTEWSIPIDANLDIVNFDAFEFGETIAMYPAEVKRHLTQGKALAWGIVPTSLAIREQNANTLFAKLDGLMENLASKTGLDKQLIAQQCMLTPSCGTGSMDLPDAEKVFSVLAELSAMFKEKNGF